MFGFLRPEFALGSEKEQGFRLFAVIVIGNIGSGKTTAVPIVEKVLNGIKMEADNIFFTIPTKDGYLRALSEIVNPNIDLVKKIDLQAIIFNHEMEMLTARMEYIKQEKGKNENGQLPIIDSGIIMNWIYVKAHHLTGRITDEQWDIFENKFNGLAGDLLKTATIIYLKDTPQSCRQRIVSRGIKFEINDYNLSYLESLHQALELFALQYGNNCGQFIEVNVGRVGDIRRGNNRNFLAEMIGKLVK